jgi:protein ImuB
LRPLLLMKLPEIDAGFGIDMLRLEVVHHEPLQLRQAAGHLAATDQARARLTDQNAVDDLMGRLGARIGMERITRRHPGESHLPEKTARTVAAAWSDRAGGWPEPRGVRPVILWQPEPVTAPSRRTVPERFRWRGRTFATLAADGPERIAPEWWFDDPQWRTGPRDYWQVTTDQGDRLWLYYAHGAALSPGWFCHGAFA